MTQAIAKVRLSPGQVGFYDELTRIHLTISNPERYILKGMNVTNIKRGVHSGRLRLISGSLEPEQKVIVKDINVPKEAPKVETPAPKAEEAKAPVIEKEKAVEVEAPVVEEAKAEPVVAEVKAEEATEEIKEEATEEAAKKPAPKKAAKKK